MAVSVPADAFDGSAHRLDVTDASTGRTHRAAYRLPARDASYELTYAGTLPGPADQAAKGMLVSAGDALYFADRDGGFLYRTARPGSDEWAPCAPAETPWGDEDSSAPRERLVRRERERPVRVHDRQGRERRGGRVRGPLRGGRR